MLTDGLECCDVFIRLSFWRHPFNAEHPLTLILTAPIPAEHPLTHILTAPIHCRASIDSHSDGTHSLQSIHWLSFWRHPFTADHPLLRHISTNLMKKQTHPDLGWSEGEHIGYKPIPLSIFPPQTHHTLSLHRKENNPNSCQKIRSLKMSRFPVTTDVQKAV